MADESASALGAPVASPTWRSPAATSLDSQGAIPLLLKRIGRGAQGSRSLERDEAAALFGWILDGIIHPAQLGAVLIALRMKGETVAEVAGVLDAVQRRLRPVGVDSARPVVAIPSYNGARKLPNLVPLLAALLARQGIQVVVHGVRTDPGRVCTAQIWQALAWPFADDLAQSSATLTSTGFVFVPIEILCPELGRLLAHRSLLGLRNVGHSVVKSINPTSVADCLRLASYTHAEFDHLLRETLSLVDAKAMLMRATEGEVVANIRRAQAIAQRTDGQWRQVRQSDPVAAVEVLMPERDAATTAAWIAAVLEDRQPVPQSIADQVAAIRAAVF